MYGHLVRRISFQILGVKGLRDAGANEACGTLNAIKTACCLLSLVR